ncbi:MAG: 5'-nucleotidase C-terminal domain-containing protein [Pseudolysinimonas sp.]|jgi:5'-nucleotidase|uniref:bifunctional metallophosphatase/5'-nucleotidase n=1 Tax=Pseudolysinimonas sp. TaxID=2680009 RepID=UPI003C78C54F
MSTKSRRRVLLAAATAALTATASAVPTLAMAGPPATPKADFTLTVLHANDMESALLPITGTDGGSYGGAARFVELFQQLEKGATSGRPAPGHAGKRGVITVSAGDNFLPGPNFSASEDSGVANYDAQAFSAAGFDASALGNHDFDLGPGYLADWLGDVSTDPAFVSNNLGFDAEPELLGRVQDGTIVTSYVERVKGERIGIIGLTTPDLPQLTSLGDVTVDPALAEIANAQAAAYAEAGVDKVILVSHLQDIDNERALAAELTGIDIIIAGGGGEVLADADDPIVPTGATRYGDYPVVETDADGDEVPIVTTTGLYQYVGRLVVTFDRDGEIISFDEELSRAIPVAAQGPDAVDPDPTVLANVEQPVAAYVAGLAETVIAQTAVPLDGIRDNVRSVETNLGDLVADSLVYAGQLAAAEAGITAPIVGLQNGGGIRINGVIPPGNVTLLTTYSVLPFPNFVSVAPDLPIETFVAVVEHGVGGAVSGDVLQPDGRFGQAAGYSFTYDASQPVGQRVVSITLDDGTVIVAGGELAATAPTTISFVTNDFTLRGGDGYPLAGVPFVVLPYTYQEALETYLIDGLGGVVSAADYPVGGEGRIVEVD